MVAAAADPASFEYWQTFFRGDGDGGRAGNVGQGADIYHTDEGLEAVTSEVQRRILRALGEGSKQLPELVQVTGRSKPTLSSLHMKELLARGLILESSHPTDNRRKVYSLAARPVDGVAAAMAPGMRPSALRVGVAEALDAMAAAPASASTSLLRSQARRLGLAARAHLGHLSRRELWLRLPSVMEENGIASPVRIDLQQGHFDLRPGPAIQASPERLALLIAGLVEGLGNDGVQPAMHVEANAFADGVRLRMS